MTQSPGHQKWPDHKIEEHSLKQKIKVDAAGQIVAESANAVELAEDKHPVRYYIPRDDIRTDALQRSSTRTKCPFKGEAQYYHVKVDGKTIEDAVWSYEDPYDEHRGLKDLLAFHGDKPDIEVKLSP